jgi:hypothetical protein
MGWFMCIIGLAFMVLAFVATGMRGAFSHLPTVPITKAGRVIVFLSGLAVFVSGIQTIISN